MMTFREYLADLGDRYVSHELEIHLHQQWPQLNLESKVEWVVNHVIYVVIQTEMPRIYTETVYVPRLDWKGRVLLALGALLDSPKWWNSGFSSEIRFNPYVLEPQRIELQEFGVRAAGLYIHDGNWVRQSTPQFRYFQTGYCAFNDTLYVRK